ncbi:MAG: MFS transporter [Methanobacteriota archaeon]|nr:MAG: MFS transporter [Euryarchaeota archaeon]
MKEGDSRIRRFYLFRALTSFALWMPFWMLWAYENLGDLYLIAVVDAWFWGTMIAFQIPAGLFGDRFGRRAALFLGEILFAVGVLAFGLSTEFWQYVASNIVWALGVCFIVSGDTPFVYDTLLELNRAKEFTQIMLTATVVMYFMNAVACAVAGVIVEVTGRLEVTLIVAALIAIVGSFTAFLLQEPKVDRSKMLSMKAHFGFGLRTIVKSRAIMILILFQMVLGIGVYVMAMFRSIYMNEDLDLTFLWIGILFSTFLLVAAIVILSARRIENVLGEKYSLVFLYVAVLSTFLVVFLVRSPIAIVMQYLMYVVAGIQGPIVNGYLNKRVDSEHRSTIMAIAVFTFTALLVVVEIGIGFVASAWGLINSLLLMAILSTPIAVLLLVMWSREVDREKSARDETSWERAALE